MRETLNRRCLEPPITDVVYLRPACTGGLQLEPTLKRQRGVNSGYPGLPQSLPSTVS